MIPIAALPGDKAGIGLRVLHYRDVIETRPSVGWFEVHTENYLGGGAWPHYLEKVREQYPVAFHCVGLSLGSASLPDPSLLERIKTLADRLEPAVVSEHLSWSIVDGAYLNDLLPFPYDAESLTNFRRNVDAVQNALKRPLLIENPSVYVALCGDMTEPEFLSDLVRSTGCGILLDVNNLYVCANNIGIDPDAYLAALPSAAVGEIHLAGHKRQPLDEGGAILIDDHGSAVSDPVWDLYGTAIRRFGPVPTLIERDNDIPSLAELAAEAARADAVAAGNLHADAA